MGRRAAPVIPTAASVSWSLPFEARYRGAVWSWTHGVSGAHLDEAMTMMLSDDPEKGRKLV